MKTITNVITMGIILISIHLFITKCTEITVYAQTMDGMAITQINEVAQDMRMELDGYVDLYSTEFYDTFFLLQMKDCNCILMMDPDTILMLI